MFEGMMIHGWPFFAAIILKGREAIDRMGRLHSAEIGVSHAGVEQTPSADTFSPFVPRFCSICGA
jgi:hypothetical protein